jgi:hypothetical protein
MNREKEPGTMVNYTLHLRTLPWGVLQLAYAFEQVTNIGKRRPVVV